MPEYTQCLATKIHIYQQNMHKSQSGQWDLLNSDANGNNSTKHYDLLLLQEPYIDYLGNPKATRAWKMIKPAVCSITPNVHS